MLLGKVRQVLARKGKTVYIADTEGSPVAQAIAKELRDERFQVFFVKNIGVFKEYWAKQPADYIVMEYQQHAIAAETLIKEIRACTSVPLIVYTYSGMDFKEKSLAAGASLYLGKPQSPTAVVTALRGLEMK